jgi:uncharacterized membrane protein (UPF0127 family)
VSQQLVVTVTAGTLGSRESAHAFNGSSLRRRATGSVIAVALAASFAQSVCGRRPTIELTTPRGVIRVELANTPRTRAEGLSGRERLEVTGLLLDWNAAGRHPIWMAGMHFPLDLVWLDAQGAVVAVAAHVSPCKRSPCSLYQPAGTEHSVAVLELAAGNAGRYGLLVGARVRRPTHGKGAVDRS